MLKLDVEANNIISLGQNSFPTKTLPDTFLGRLEHIALKCTVCFCYLGCEKYDQLGAKLCENL